MPLPIKLSVKAVVLDARGRVLLLRRSAASKNNAGKWEFPGGKLDPGEAVDEALRREVREETGLSVEIGDVVGACQSVLPKLRVAYMFFEAHVSSDAVLLSDEHDAFVWTPLSDLASHNLSPQFRVLAERYAAGSRVDG